MTPQQPFASPNPGVSPAMPPAPGPVPPVAAPNAPQPSVDPFANANSIQMAPEPVFQTPVAQPQPVAPVAAAQPAPVANPAPVAQPAPAPVSTPVNPAPVAPAPAAPPAPAPVDPSILAAQPAPANPAPVTQPAPVPEPTPVAAPALTPTPEATPAPAPAVAAAAPAPVPEPTSEVEIIPAASVAPAADDQPMMGEQDIPELEPIDPEVDATQQMGAVDMDPEITATLESAAEAAASPEVLAAETAAAESAQTQKPTPPIAPTIARGPTTQIENPVTEAPAAMPPTGLFPEPVKRRGKLPLIIGIILLLLIAGGVAAFFLLSNRKNEITILEDNAIFLPESLADDAKTAVFNYKTGTKLTEFDYKYNSNFAGGYAVVTNSDGKDAIINNTGKIIVNYDAYEHIGDCGPLYVARKENTTTLINAMGQKVTDLHDSDQTLCPVTGGGFFMVVRHDGKQNDIYNIHGQKIDDFETDQDVIFRIGDDLTSISYPGKIITLDNEELKTLNKYTGDSEKNFGLHNAQGKTGVMIISADKIDPETGEAKGIDYGVIAGDKIYDYSDQCEEILFYEDSGVALCQKYSDNFDILSNFIVREDGSLEELDAKALYHFTSSADYIKVIYGTSAKIEFYKNNEVANTLTGDFSRFIFYKENISASDINTGRTMLYNGVGEKVIEINQRGTILGPFDGDVFLVDVAEGSYLYSKEGKRLSRTFTAIYPTDCGLFRTRQYVDYSSTPSTQLLNSEGVEVTKASEYSSFQCLDNNNVLAVSRSKDTFDVLGADYAVLASGEYGDYVSSSRGYIRVEFDSPKKITYYTLDGVKFHEYGE